MPTAAGKVGADGRLTNMSYRTPGPGEVELLTIPKGHGPWAYDAVNKVAIPATKQLVEKLDDIDLTPRQVAALFKAIWCLTQTPPVALPAWVKTVLGNANTWITAQGG